MPSFKFIGPHVVDVPALGLGGVEPGQVVEVTNEQAEGLAGQGSWERLTAKKSTTEKKD